MKKSELRSGMMVKTRNGQRAIVMLNTPNGDAIVGGEGNYNNYTWQYLSSYNEDLTCKIPGCEISDIVKVYRFQSNMKGASFDRPESDVIWERKEPIELTMDEIARKFNIPVSQLKIKK